MFSPLIASLCPTWLIGTQAFESDSFRVTLLKQYRSSETNTLILHIGKIGLIRVLSCITGNYYLFRTLYYYCSFVFHLVPDFDFSWPVYAPEVGRTEKIVKLLLFCIRNKKIVTTVFSFHPLGPLFPPMWVCIWVWAHECGCPQARVVRFQWIWSYLQLQVS